MPKRKRSKAWKPDKALPKTTYNSYGDIYDVITGNRLTPLMGYWQWVDDDTISWSLTKNSRKQAIKLGAETGGFLEAIYYEYNGTLSDKPDGIQRFEMFRDPNKSSRLLPEYATGFWATAEEGIFRGGFDVAGSAALSETKNTGKSYKLIYEHGSPVGEADDIYGHRMDTEFALLNERYFRIAAGTI